jgi:cytochrome c-type biogenesis protein
VDLRQLVLNWYALLSSLNAGLVEPLDSLSNAIGVPLVAALLFGLLGATSPCQLTTNASALAFVSRGFGAPRAPLVLAAAYLAGKTLVYTVLGVAVIVAGQQLASQSIPFLVIARKALGPLMLLIGLAFLGVVRLNLSFGQGLSAWLQARAQDGLHGSFLLGTAFAFAFCPTLFLLFFGLTIPLALQSPFGVLYPPAFALGTTLPLMGFTGALALGASGVAGYVRGVGGANRWLERIAGGVLVVAGLNDTFVYWLM